MNNKLLLCITLMSSGLVLNASFDIERSLHVYNEQKKRIRSEQAKLLMPYFTQKALELGISFEELTKNVDLVRRFKKEFTAFCPQMKALQEEERALDARMLGKEERCFRAYVARARVSNISTRERSRRSLGEQFAIEAAYSVAQESEAEAQQKNLDRLRKRLQTLKASAASADEIKAATEEYRAALQKIK